MVLTIFSVHHLLNILDFDMVDLNLCGLHQLRHKLHLKIKAENPAGNIICQQTSLEFQQPDYIQKTTVKHRISVTVKAVIDDLIVRIRLSEVLKESILDQFPKGWMAKDTKEKILTAALDLFSQNGYAGTNIRELTGSLGLGKSSMYRHFESKEDIWNTLLDELIAYYEARFGSPECLPPVPDSLEDLVVMTMGMVDFTVHDEKVVKSRKLLAIEQFRDERARDLASKYFLTGLTAMFTQLFAAMMEKGLLRRDDPSMLAFAYTAPISALIHLCDREPEKREGAVAQAEAFSRHFAAVYGGDGA